jgi:hypothetical protein
MEAGVQDAAEVVSRAEAAGAEAAEAQEAGNCSANASFASFSQILFRRRVIPVNGNAELLNFIYQNAEMGVETLNKLKAVTDDGEFEKVLDAQYAEYKEINDVARSLLNKNGYDEKGINAMQRIRTYLMLNLQTMMDKTTSHIAEMIMVGSSMGIIDAVKNLKQYKDDAEPEIVQLMERLLRFEENNFQQMKQFL